MTVPVEFESVPVLGAGVHGTETGPARLSLPIGEPDAQGNRPITARIKVYEDLAAHELPRVLKHELNELSYLAAERPANWQVAVKSMEARLFKPNETGQTRRDKRVVAQLVPMINRLRGNL